VDLYLGQESMDILIESLLTIVGQCRSIGEWYNQIELYAALLLEQYIEPKASSNIAEALSSKTNLQTDKLDSMLIMFQLPLSPTNVSHFQQIIQQKDRAKEIISNWIQAYSQ
jgi:hypothetical protein